MAIFHQNFYKQVAFCVIVLIFSPCSHLQAKYENMGKEIYFCVHKNVVSTSLCISPPLLRSKG